MVKLLLMGGRFFWSWDLFRVYNNHSNNFTDGIFIGEVFQIEVSDVVDLVHPLEIIKKSTWMQLECLWENAFSVFHMKVSNNQSNESINSICIGEVFQVEVSDDLIHPF